MRVVLLAILSVFQIILSGCYLDSSIGSLDSTNNAPNLPTIKFNKTTTVGSVSGSSNYALTPVSGFKVKQSAGLVLNKQLAKTPSGYKIYLNLSGRLTSEEE